MLPTFDAVDRHPVAAFAVLAVGLSWAAWIPALSVFEGPVRTAAIVPGAFGPGVAAAVVVRLRGGSVRRWLAETVDWRCPPRWYVAAVAVPVGASVAIGAAVLWFAGGVDPEAVGPTAVAFAVNVPFAALLGGGQEEFGWRGFALPHLQARYGALAASGLVGLLWALWHAPMFAFGVYPHSPALYAAAVVAFAVVLTWLYNGSGGCVPVAVLAHGLINAAVNVPVGLVGGADALPVPFAGLLAVGFGAVALALVARHGGETLSAGRAATATWTDRAAATTGEASAPAAGDD